MFELQVGDVADLGDFYFERTVIALSQRKVYCQDSTNGVLDGERGDSNFIVDEPRGQFMKAIKTIHRPTPDGMVQVWPEVKGE